MVNGMGFIFFCGFSLRAASFSKFISDPIVCVECIAATNGINKSILHILEPNVNVDLFFVLIFRYVYT